MCCAEDPWGWTVSYWKAGRSAEIPWEWMAEWRKVGRAVMMLKVWWRATANESSGGGLGEERTAVRYVEIVATEAKAVSESATPERKQG